MNIDGNLIQHTQIIDWATKIIDTNNITAQVIAHTPWSSVIKLRSDKNIYYLKQTPHALFLEVDVIDICRKACHIQDIPQVVAANKNLLCFLMRECGEVSLREAFAGNLSVQLIVTGLRLYNQFQKATIAQTDDFLKVGVPDWRLSQFPSLYKNLVNDKAFIRAHGIEETELAILQSGVQTIGELTSKLSALGITECLNHTDFHDANILYSYSSQKAFLIDLGETAITHPIFSRLAFFQNLSDRYHVSPRSDEYHILFDACFDFYTFDNENISKAIKIGEQLLPLYLIFAQKRFLDSIDLPYDENNQLSLKQHGKINKSLKSIVNILLEYNDV